MIARITLENFFSFSSPTTILLNPKANILVGINGSGKSNFLKAIRLLRDSIVGDGFEKTFLKDWSGFNAVANYSKNQPDFINLFFEFDKSALNNTSKQRGYVFKDNPVYEISVVRAGATSYFLREKLYLKKTNGSKDSPFVLMEIENGRGIISTRDNNTIGFQKYPHAEKEVSFKTTELVLRQISDPDRYFPLFTLKRALEGLSVYDYFDTTLKSIIRQPGSYGIEERLVPDGQNLMSTLNRIKNYHSLDYDTVESYIKNINPYFKDISIDVLGSKLILMLREQHLSKSVSIEHVSDGTLRFLLFLAIFINPERGKIVCIDEPENGLHPDMINSIAKMIKAATNTGTQVIVATHSPLLLNAFTLDEVLIFEKSAANQSEVQYKSEDDFEDWNENTLVGQLWLRGWIGGKRW